MITEIETVALILERRGYVVLHMRQPTDKSAGIVAFASKEALSPERNSPRTFAAVTLSRTEIDSLRRLHASRDYLFDRVDLAERELAS